MSNINNTTASPSATKHRRTVAEIREEYESFVNLYNSRITPLEIMRKLNISKVQYKKYFADAIFFTHINLIKYDYDTCEGKRLTDHMLAMIQANKKDLIRYEPFDGNKIIVYKVDM